MNQEDRLNLVCILMDDFTICNVKRKLKRDVTPVERSRMFGLELV